MESCKIFVVLVLHYCFICVFSKDLPPYIHTCKRNDPEFAKCYEQSVRHLEPYLEKGIPELEMPALNPYLFRNISVTIQEPSINVKADLINGSVTNLAKVQIKNVLMDFSTGIFEYIVRYPSIRLQTHYKLKGKILLFEVDGEGMAEFNASDVQGDFVEQAKMYTKDGAEYASIEFVSLQLNIKHMSIKLNNLIKNNELLSDAVNNAINDNIESLKQQLDPLIVSTIAEIYKDGFTKIYSMFPLDQLFPKD